MREIYCLLDANSVIKHYVDLPGSEVVNYLFEKSPTAVINISNVQIAEVVSIFYKFHREGIITSVQELEEFKDTFFNDMKTGKITRYAFVDEHILDFEVYRKITETAPPVQKPIRTFIPQFGGFVSELKDIANTGDAIMLMVMREINYLTEGNSCLVTCDGHVLNVAQQLNLRVLNPEKCNIASIPQCLDIRRSKRLKSPTLKIVCKDNFSKEEIGSTSSIDICEGGVLVRKKSNLREGRNIVLRLSPINKKEPVIEQAGQVVRSTEWANAIRFLEPIPDNLYSALVN